jgi:iron complex outermembrane recepter protein
LSRLNKRNPIAKAVKLALLATATVTAFSMPTAFSAEEEEVQENKITITGTAIKRTDVEGNLPVTTIDKEDIARSGVQSVTDLIQNLPNMQGFTTPSQSVGGGGGGVTTASIHDIGSQYTLVLLNGRRMAPSGSGSTIDLNSIPLSAIERVEILSDGASALYGSDAIAGVVNFITKSDYTGINASVRFSQPANEGGEASAFNITGGFGEIDSDGYNILVSLSKDSQGQLAAKDRDFARTGLISFTDHGQDYFYFAGSSNSIPGNAYVDYTDAAGDAQSWTFNPYRMQNGGNCAEDNTPYQDYCFFDYTSTLEIYPESERDSLMVNSLFEVNNDLTLFANFNYTDSSVISRIAPYPTGRMNITNAALIAQWITPNLPAGATIDRVRGTWRAIPAGNRTTEYQTTSTNLVVGAMGMIDDIDYEVAVTRSVNDGDQNFLTGWLIQEPFLNAVEAGEIDIFAPVGTVTPAQTEGFNYTGNWSNSTTSVNAFDGRASMPIFEMSEGDAYLATGFEVRNTTWEQTTSDANKQEIILFFGADDEYKMERQNYGLFAELMMPLAEGLEVNTSFRYDSLGAVNYNGADVNEDDADTTWKVSLSYKVNDDLKLRASSGTGFKAPSMLAIASPRREAGVTGGNYQCPFAPGDILETYCLSGTAQYTVFAQGNPDLKNEHSSQESFGLVYAPSQDFGVTLDYWSVSIDDAVSGLSEQQIFDQPVLYRDLFTYNENSSTGDRELAIIQASVNVGASEYSGIDWNMVVRNDMSFGKITTRFSGTYMLESENTRPGTSDDFTSSMGRFGEYDSVTFRTMFKITNTLSHGDFNHTLTASFKSGYDDQFQDQNDCNVSFTDATGACADLQLAPGNYTKLDWVTEYQLNDNLNLSFGINNLADKTPPRAFGSGGSHQVGYDSRYYDVFGRTYYMSASYDF